VHEEEKTFTFTKTFSQTLTQTRTLFIIKNETFRNFFIKKKTKSFKKINLKSNALSCLGKSWIKLISQVSTINTYIYQIISFALICLYNWNALDIILSSLWGVSFPLLHFYFFIIWFKHLILCFKCRLFRILQEQHTIVKSKLE